MESFATKYAAAAHLAMVVTVPLFLVSFCGSGAIGTVLLWLSAFSLVWTVMAPSNRPGEPMHLARARILSSLVRDPLLWILLLLVALSALRIVNNGVALAYDPEASAWSLSFPEAIWIPSSVPGSGYLPFCTSVATLVVLTGARHALDMRARSSFRAWTAAFSGMAAAISLFSLVRGNAGAVALASCRLADAPSYVGVAFGIASLVSLVSVCEFASRSSVLPLLAVSAAMMANMLALVAFAPAAEAAVFLLALAILLAVQMLRAVLRGPKVLRWMLPLAVAFVTVFFAFLGPKVLQGTPAAQRFPGRVAVEDMLPAGFAGVRAALSDVALKVWQTAPWTGRGLGSFPDALRFSGDAETWKVVRFRATAPLNGYLGVLAERGVIGLAAFVVVFVCLAWSYFRSFAGGGDFPSATHPVRALFPLATAVLALLAAFEVSFTRTDVILVSLVALMAPVRTRAIPAEEERHG